VALEIILSALRPVCYICATVTGKQRHNGSNNHYPTTTEIARAAR
jgi:hypothetical protein